MKLFKSAISVLSLFFVSFIASAQWSLTGNGSTDPSSNYIGTTDVQPLLFKINKEEVFRLTTGKRVGIGTTTPGYKLGIHVTPGAGAGDGLRVSTSTGTVQANYIVTGNTWNWSGVGANEAWLYSQYADLNVGPEGNFNLKFIANVAERMRITGTGLVGIGTTTPSHRLTVNGAISTNNNIVMTGAASAITGVSAGYTRLIGGTATDPAVTLYGSDYTTGGNAKHMTLDAEVIRLRQLNGTDVMRVMPAGIAINTACIPTGYKLAVKGNIICEKLKVKPEGGNCWADYVFDEGYALLKLNDVESFIAQNKHLPGVPSAAEVAENGIELAEMDATLLKKIEELTLYVIELQKQVDELKKKQ
jgi:hypothetical protein